MQRKFLFLGDSITDAEHLWLPEYNNLGNGFVHMIQQDFNTSRQNITCINKGQNGFTTAALLRTLPQILSTESYEFIHLLIGINDVGVAYETNVSLSELCFRKNICAILDLLTATGANILVSGPFLFPRPARLIHWFPILSEAESILSFETAQKNVRFLPLHTHFNEIAKEIGYNNITDDGIHLSQYGHKLLANQILYSYSSEGFM